MLHNESSPLHGSMKRVFIGSSEGSGITPEIQSMVDVPIHQEDLAVQRTPLIDPVISMVTEKTASTPTPLTTQAHTQAGTPPSMRQTISNIDAHVEGEQFHESKQSRTKVDDWEFKGLFGALLVDNVKEQRWVCEMIPSCLKGGSGNSGGKRLVISMVEEAWLSEKEENAFVEEKECFFEEKECFRRREKNVFVKEKECFVEEKECFVEEKECFHRREKNVFVEEKECSVKEKESFCQREKDVFVEEKRRAF
ncbi:hypothetical protein Tco_0808823 [Tanacetum coccineum]